MKNKFHLALIAMLLTVLFTQISCSKDKITPVGGRPNAAYTNRITPEIQPFDVDSVSTGGLYLQIAPLEAKAVVTVYNDSYTSGPIAMNYTEGILSLGGLEAGFYKIQIRPINTAYLPVLIDNVEIIAEQKTNLGTIVLSN